MNTEDQGYTDGGPNPHYVGDCKYCQMKADMINDLAMLVRRLTRRIRTHDPEDKVAENAMHVLRLGGLQGSPLRQPSNGIQE